MFRRIIWKLACVVHRLLCHWSGHVWRRYEPMDEPGVWVYDCQRCPHRERRYFRVRSLFK